MEYCPNGELLNYIVSKKRLAEGEAKVYLKHALDGLSFMHSRGIVHRDIKPENVLIDMEGHAKLSDFGLAKYVGKSGMTSTPCGSPIYVAPEILTTGEYNAFKTDMWSVGVLLYIMVVGQIPWGKGNQAQIFHQIKKGGYRIPPFLSVECGKLIQNLMTLDPDSRLSASQALLHSFLYEMQTEVIEWREVPIVSLRRLDKFFEIEDSKENLKLKYKPVSTSKIKITFKKMEKELNQKLSNAKIGNDVMFSVKPSQSTWVNPANAGVKPYDTATLNQIKTSWKAVLRNVNKRKAKRASIVRPVVDSIQ